MAKCDELTTKNDDEPRMDNADLAFDWANLAIRVAETTLAHSLEINSIRFG
jgi:hypothetical protein